MSASLSILHCPPASAVSQEESAGLALAPEAIGEAEQFAQEQIRGLVRRVFVPGWPRPSRQVVFSAAGAEMDMTRICVRTAEALASGGAGRICLVEADLHSRPLEQSFGRTSNDGGDSLETAGAVRASSRQISQGLWLVPAKTFLGTAANADSAAWLRLRLGELRREFDYAVIHAAAAVQWAGTALLSQLADGLVLGVEAHRTRRLCVRSVRDQLVGANVRVLGIVLGERRFPIPEQLYRRL